MPFKMFLILENPPVGKFYDPFFLETPNSFLLQLSLSDYSFDVTYSFCLLLSFNFNPLPTYEL